MSTANSQDASSILTRSFAVTEFIARTGRSVSVAEIGRELDLPKPSAHRICKILENMGIIVRDPISKGMVVGPRLSAIALNSMLASSDVAARRSILRDVVRETGETCTLTTIDGDELLFLDRVESTSPLRLQLFTGSRVPLHCTAGGKLFLAFLPNEKRKQFIRSARFQRYTEHTITDPESLKRELERIKQERVSRDNQEFVPGLVALAVPVIDKSRRICASLSINAPSGRISMEKIARHVHALRRASQSLTTFFDKD